MLLTVTQWKSDKRQAIGVDSLVAPNLTLSQSCVTEDFPANLSGKIPDDDVNILKSSAANPSDDGWVTYIVGGQAFEVAKTTVLKFPDTILAKMITGQFDQTDLRIDRDPARFRYILNWLRDGTLILPINISKEEMITEVNYYNLPIQESDIHYAPFPHMSALSDFQRHVFEVVSASCNKFESMIDSLIRSRLDREIFLGHLWHANRVALHVAKHLKRQLSDRKSLCVRGFETSCHLPAGNSSSFRTRADVEEALDKFTNTKKFILDNECTSSRAFLKLVNKTMKYDDIEVVGISNDGEVEYQIKKPQ